ncbi:MAG: YfiR family protein [Gemmatimonadales bacterium]
MSARVVFVSALLLAAARGLGAQAVRASEYQVKAVFLFNFAQFVDWPPEAFNDPQAPLVIGVLGDDPFGPVLDATVRGETVRGRPLEIRRSRRIDEILTCHILFISQSEADRLDDIVAALRSRPILTVGDGETFARRGGVVRLVVERGRVRFHINLEAAAAARLTISSKLLRLAEIVPRRGR